MGVVRGTLLSSFLMHFVHYNLSRVAFTCLCVCVCVCVWLINGVQEATVASFHTFVVVVVIFSN